MNTETGRIYDLHELYPDEKKRQAEMDSDLSAAKAELRQHFMALPTAEVQFSDPAIELSVREARAELARATAVHKATAVSSEVAHTMKLGQKAKVRRAKRRKADKQARKRNR